jgi:hypothetical protein
MVVKNHLHSSSDVQPSCVGHNYHIKYTLGLLISRIVSRTTIKLTIMKHNLKITLYITSGGQVTFKK